MFCSAAAESCGDVNTAGAEQMARPRAGRARIARFVGSNRSFCGAEAREGGAWFGEHPPGQEVVLLCSPLLPTPSNAAPQLQAPLAAAQLG